MSTPQATLKTISDRAIVRLINGGGDLEIVFEHELDFSLGAEATGVARTMDVPEYAIHEYQSIGPLKGMCANDPSWDDLPDFLERYWREIDETVETD
jgi:hypothetical protein